MILQGIVLKRPVDLVSSWPSQSLTCLEGHSVADAFLVSQRQERQQPSQRAKRHMKSLDQLRNLLECHKCPKLYKTAKHHCLVFPSSCCCQSSEWTPKASDSTWHLQHLQRGPETLCFRINRKCSKETMAAPAGRVSVCAVKALLSVS